MHAADDGAEPRPSSFFNDKIVRDWRAPGADGERPHWLFILSQTDYEAQSMFETQLGFADVVAGKLVERLEGLDFSVSH